MDDDVATWLRYNWNKILSDAVRWSIKETRNFLILSQDTRGAGKVNIPPKDEKWGGVIGELAFSIN